MADNQFAIIVVLWIILGALIGAAIGNIKRRPEAGFVFGMLLGPLGWLIVGLGPDVGPKCPECGGEVVEGKPKCKNCGAEVHWPEQEEEAQTDPSSRAPAHPAGTVIFWSIITVIALVIGMSLISELT